MKTRKPRLRTGANIYRLRVQLESARDVWRTIDLRGNQTLEDLHRAIQIAFDWDDDHAYAFFLSGKYWDKDTCYVPSRQAEWDRSASDDQVSRRTDSAVLDRIGLYRNKVIAYLFDFGDEWRHRIKILEIGPAREDEDCPRIVAESGEAPDQYPSQEEGDGQRPSPSALLSRSGVPATLVEKARLEIKNAALQRSSRELLLRQYRLASELSAACGQDKVKTDNLDQLLRGELHDWLSNLQKNLAAERLVKEAVELGPSWPHVDRVEFLLADRALILAKAGLAEEARRQVREIQEQFPGEWAARMLSGNALEVIRDLPAAEAHYRQCLADLEVGKERKYQNHFRRAILQCLISVLRRVGKKAEARDMAALASQGSLEQRVPAC